MVQFKNISKTITASGPNYVNALFKIHYMYNKHTIIKEVIGPWFNGMFLYHCLYSHMNRYRNSVFKIK